MKNFYLLFFIFSYFSLNSVQASKVFNVVDFGAIGNALKDDTKSFQFTWIAACAAEADNVTFLVPASRSFLLQQIFFRGPCISAMYIQVDGVLLAPDGPDSWLTSNKLLWLVFQSVDHLTVQGKGLVDGRGKKWWNLPCKLHKGSARDGCDSPVAMRFYKCTRLRLREFSVRDSPQFNIKIDTCTDVHIDTLRISCPASSPNTDGIHVGESSHVGIYDSTISVGDDCVSIGSGTHHIDIKNIFCGPSHGISIGSLGENHSKACVSNITITHSSIVNSDNGARIKTWQGGSGSAKRITFDHINMINVRNPIIIDQNYCLVKPCKNGTSGVSIVDVTYSNINGTYDTRSLPVHLGCGVPCKNIILSGINLLPKGGKTSGGVFCSNAYGWEQKPNVPDVTCLLKGSPRSNYIEVCPS